MNVRSGPSTSTSVKTTVKHGSYVQLLATNGEWTKVLTTGGNRGYIKTKYLVETSASDTAPTAAPTQTPAPDTQNDAQGKVIFATFSAVTTDDAPMYTQNSASSAKIGVIPAGSGVTIYAFNDIWAYLSYGKYDGFVLRTALEAK